MKIIICGSRTFDNYELLRKKMNFFTFDLDKKKLEIVSGGQKTSIVGLGGRYVEPYGADHLGERWARENLLKYYIFHAEWDKHGKSAGFIRNQEMVDFIGPKGAVIAFWDQHSPGTRDTITRARRAGIRVRIVPFTPE